MLVMHCLFHSRLCGQCITMKWTDEALRQHRGFFQIATLPDYSYFEPDYADYKLLRLSVFDTARLKDPVHKQTYRNGYLAEEMKYDFNVEGYDYLTRYDTMYGGTKELHRYFYKNNRRTVTDSISYIVFQNIRSANGKRFHRVIADTVHDVETWVFDADLKITSLYNPSGFSLPHRPGSSLGEWDSIAYHYDRCGNCDKITGYAGGKGYDADYEYTYSNAENGQYTSIYVQLKGEPKQSESWQFNPQGQLTEIWVHRVPGPKPVEIEYAKGKIVRYKSTDVGNAEYITESYYSYDKNGNLAGVRRSHSEKTYLGGGRSGTPKPGRDEHIRIERYANGLIKRNIDGRLIRYAYD